MNAAKAMLTAPVYGDFFASAGDSIVNHRGDFLYAFGPAIYRYVRDQLKAYVTAAKKIVGWTAATASCLLEIGEEFFDSDHVPQTNACQTFRTIGKASESVANAVKELWAMGLSRVIELAKELLTVIFDALNQLLTEAVKWLADHKDLISNWLRTTARVAR